MSLTAVINGAASGIDLASAKLLLKDGRWVMAFDPKVDRMRNELPDHGEMTYFGGDVSKSKHCSEVIVKTVKEFTIC